MTQQQNKTDRFKPSKQHLIIGLGVLAVVYLCGLLISKNWHEEKRYAKADILEFKNFSDLQAPKITIKNKHGLYDLIFEKDTALLPPQAVAHFTVPYTIQAKWQDKDGSYRDALWSVDKRGVGYTITLDGFEDGQTVSLMVNNDTPVKKTPFDWSGKIEFPVLLHDDKDFSVCVDIHGPQDGKICHRIIGKKSGAV